jgi:hypothetical protein
MSKSQNYLRPHRRLPRWLIVLVAASVTSAAVAAFELLHIAERSAQVKQQIGQLKVPPPVKRVLTRSEEERKAQWEKLRTERNFNWYPIFVALERSGSDDLELLEFLPDKANGLMTLRGEAKDIDALVHYMARLSEQPGIGQAYLSRQKKSTREALQVIAFELHAPIIQISTKQKKTLHK